jgi:hypothetical protein
MPKLDGRPALAQPVSPPLSSGQRDPAQDFYASIPPAPQSQRTGGQRQPGSPKPRESVKFDWNRWNAGGKVVFVAACVATASMLFDWVSIGIASANGISQGTFLFLALFVYPVWMLLTNRPIHRTGGIACGAVGILFTFGYIASKQTEIFDRSVNLASGGAYLFLLACIALIVGVIKYSPVIDLPGNAPEPAMD